MDHLLVDASSCMNDIHQLVVQFIRVVQFYAGSKLRLIYCRSNLWYRLFLLVPTQKKVLRMAKSLLKNKVQNETSHLAVKKLHSHFLDELEYLGLGTVSDRLINS